MSLAGTLRDARADVAGGWTEPFCLDSEGRVCPANSEGVRTFSVEESVRLHASNSAEWVAALELLETLACPATAALNQIAENMAAGIETNLVTNDVAAISAAAISAPSSLAEWLERPGRPLSQVLKLFDLALLRAKTKEAT